MMNLLNQVEVSGLNPEQPGELSPTGVAFDTGGVQDALLYKPCPLCGGSPIALQPYMYVMSFVVVTRHQKYEAWFCRACSTRRGLREMGKSALLGWWGIPWGVMTFRALWVNTRTLIRWSTLAPTTALIVGFAGVIPPAALGVWFYQQAVAEDAARATGDWVDDQTVALVEAGHQRDEEGDMEAALESYRAAYARAPGSSVVNSSVAYALYSLGRPSEALTYAAQAESANPDDCHIVALHALILLETGDEAGARGRAGRLRACDPEDDADATAMVNLFERLKDYEEMLRAAEKGLALASGDPAHAIARIDALLRLDKVAEAEVHLEAMNPTDQSPSYTRFLKVACRMSTAPAAGLEGMLKLWKEGLLNDELMQRLVGIAGTSTEMDSMQSKVILWLHEASTPADAWQHAIFWFDEADWVPQLDRYLEQRLEVVPAVLRLQEMDTIADNQKILALADAVRGREHAWAEGADSHYFGALAREVPWGEFRAALQEHVDEKPAHTQCRYTLCRYLLEDDFESALPHLEELEKQAADLPQARSWVKLLRIEQQVIEGDAAGAVVALKRMPPDAATRTQIPFYLAEAAFHAGYVEALDESLKEIGGYRNVSAEAAALLLRWSEQIVHGIVPTYNLDVELYVRQYGDSIKRSESASAQAILVSEGVVDRAAARRVVGDRASETFDFVAAIRRTAREGRISLSSFEALASSPRRGAYGVRLARTIVERTHKARNTGA